MCHIVSPGFRCDWEIFHAARARTYVTCEFKDIVEVLVRLDQIVRSISLGQRS